MRKFLKHIMTGKDNETFDVVRVAIAIMVFMLPLILVFSLYKYNQAFDNNKNYDISSLFNAVFIFYGGAATFIAGGAASLLLKKDTEPSGE